MNPTLVLNLPPKFIGLLQAAVTCRIKAMQQMLDHPNTSEKDLADIDYGNDQMILKIIVEALENPNNQVHAECYQLSGNEDNTELTLQKFGKPIAKDEQLIFAFTAKSSTEAMAIKNQFLGFAPYQPMPENIVATQTHHYKDEQGIEHDVTATVYQPQQFGRVWQCDYQLSGYGETSYETAYSAESFEVVELAITAIKEALHQFELNNPNLNKH